MGDLYEITLPPQKGTVEYLEDLLARAKTGNIQGFAVAVVYNNARTGSGWVGIGDTCMSVIGEIESMKVDIIRSKVEQRYDCYGESLD